MYFLHDTRTAAQGRDYMGLTQHTDKVLLIPHEANTASLSLVFLSVTHHIPVVINFSISSF